MRFADMRNDIVFRRIFGKHPDILRGLLNDLLDRRGEHAIEGITYLPETQLPLAEGSKLSILDVRCRDRSGTTFVVEMQLLHVPGFLNRIVYNACKAYVDQLKAGASYATLTDVYVISICDFELWPDAAQEAAGEPPIPMVSRWHMTERDSGGRGLLQVQYAFVELPKLPPGRPESGADLWAWLFVHAPGLTEVPEDLPSGPYREAVELANQATFTRDEMDAYRRVIDEIQQARDFGAGQRAEGEAQGRAEGKAEGKVEGKAEAILTFLQARGIAVSDAAREQIVACTDDAPLDLLIARAAVASSADEVVGP